MPGVELVSTYRIAPRHGHGRTLRGMLYACLAAGAGCSAMMNGWLDPTAIGEFKRSSTIEIRSTLTLEDAPSGIPGAVAPSAEDLQVRYEEYPIAAGDTLALEIYELRQRQTPFQAQVVVSPTGYVNLPIVRRVYAAGLTVSELEDRIRESLQVQQVLRDPDLTVSPLFLQNATYSIFGIGVSAANDAPLRAGTFPIRRPDLRLLEAINQVGGLNEFVADVYLFRQDRPSWSAQPPLTVEPFDGPGTPSTPGPDTNQAPPKGATPTDSDKGSGLGQLEEPQAELLGALDPARPEVKSELKAAATDQEELVESAPPQSYIWVDDRFVPTKTYRQAPKESSAAEPVIETIIPAVNWARIASGTPARVLRIPARHLRDGNPDVNIVVRPGDVIRIVSGEIGAYYVMGQVNRVGPFSFNAESITLKAAIAGAGGLSGLAWPDRCTVYRRLGEREQMIQVNLDRIFAGKDPDFVVKRGDIINVGTHPFAPFLQRIRLLTLPTPVNNVGYSFTYARNYADIDSFSVRTNPHNEPDRFPALFP